MVDQPSRQRTLRSAIDWSYALLPRDEQLLLARLAVFSGGATLEAVDSICGEGLDVLNGLEQLLDHSLLRQEGEVEPRFRMLETIREYAQEKLREGGEEHDLRRRHVGHFLALAEAAQQELYGPRQAEWLRRLEQEHDNLRAALDWSFAGGDPEEGARLAVQLWRFWCI